MSVSNSATDLSPKRPSTGTTPPLVLVVDDSEDMRALLRDVLQHAGWEVASAATGDGALRVMARRRPDVVITDLFMPGMSGFSLRSAMLQRPELSDIPVVVLSGYWRRPSETLEVADVLPKPLNVKRLLASVRRILASADEAPGA